MFLLVAVKSIEKEEKPSPAGSIIFVLASYTGPSAMKRGRNIPVSTGILMKGSGKTRATKYHEKRKLIYEGRRFRAGAAGEEKKEKTIAQASLCLFGRIRVLLHKAVWKPGKSVAQVNPAFSRAVHL